VSALEVDPPRNAHDGRGGRDGHDVSDRRADAPLQPIPPVQPDHPRLDAPADHADVFTISAEEVHVPERLIAAPMAGVFRAAPPDVVTTEGEIVHAGQVVGSIEVTDGAVAVTSAHTGFLMGLLALPGERVRADQPLAWVRIVA
jgi:biotin carboxyl carrier protein